MPLINDLMFVILFFRLIFLWLLRSVELDFPGGLWGLLSISSAAISLVLFLYGNKAPRMPPLGRVR
jgi:CHASE2 domain-containing sensor protein